ncbi:ABC transporter ATP-binding protein/permease [Desulfococcus sp.]|uniref:ABC transporter ATP-binding protein/permease n=1 Tax=Desulfococcus sp. TaxID=2025834 RepID=UPI0035938AC8
MKRYQTSRPVTERSLFSWVLSSSINLQLVLLVIIVITVFARVVPLEMQKKIINEAIFLKKHELLMIYCGIYLIAVLTSTVFKYLTSVIQTILGQRALAGMRRAVYHHILTLPIHFYRKTQPGMVVSALVTELATAGDFVGMAVAIPVTNILTLLAFGAYLFWLHPLLAAVSLSIYPVVFILIPLLQARANTANKKRVDITRDLSDKIGESISGIHEIHTNGAYAIENRKFDAIVERLMKVRIVWNLYRFGVKTTNNFLNSLSPFLIFIIGGYLAINGQLALGSLVAFLSAQEKLYDPWRELLDFYQSYQDATVSYRRVMEYFDAAPEHLLEPQGRPPFDLDGGIEVKDLSFYTENGIRLLDRVSFSLEPGKHMAVVGFSGSGKSTLALCLNQLYKYQGGQVRIGGREVSELTKKDITRNMGTVSQSPFIFEGTIEENLLYSCRALQESSDDEYPVALPSLDDRIAALQQAGIFVDVLRFGLNMHLNQTDHADLVGRIIRIREAFRDEFGDKIHDLIEFFDEKTYLYHSSVMDNIVFGATDQPALSGVNLSRNNYFLAYLDAAGLTAPLSNLGAEVVTQTVDILGDLPPEAIFFEQSPLEPHEMETYTPLAERLKKMHRRQLADEDRQMLLDAALRFSPGRHKMVSLPPGLESLILSGRAQFRETVSRDYPEIFAFYDAARYIPSETILNNILFGKLKSQHPKAQEKINQSAIQLLIQDDLLETILKIGMQFQVGSKGDRLSGGQRQKLAIARIFLKAPKILIMDEATSALDNKSQARIQNLLENHWKGKSTVISIAHRLDIIKNYDYIAVMKSGKIAELGGYDELIRKKGLLHELVHGKS